MAVTHLPELDWSPDHRLDARSALYEHATGLALEAEAWYAAARPMKRRAGRLLRIGTILLGAAAAVLPIISELTTGEGGGPAVAPGWSAVALAAAAAFVSLDHFFGFTSGWMRYMTAEIDIRRCRHEFEYAWNQQRATDPAADAALIGLAWTFVRRVDDVLARETASWITEFRGGLAQTERGLGGVNPPDAAPSPTG